MYFIYDSKSTKTVKREIVELMFEKIQADSNEDAVIVVLVYLVSHALLSNVNNVGVPDFIFCLANDLDAFNEHPWVTWCGMRQKRGLLKVTMNGNNECRS